MTGNAVTCAECFLDMMPQAWGHVVLLNDVGGPLRISEGLPTWPAKAMPICRICARGMKRRYFVSRLDGSSNMTVLRMYKGGMMLTEAEKKAAMTATYFKEGKAWGFKGEL